MSLLSTAARPFSPGTKLVHKVYTAEDAELAIKHGLDGIIVSNHGGRQLDGVPASLDILREVVAVAKGHIPIAVDGGIRRGTDIFKALALGADFCFAGRPAIWGLAVSSMCYATTQNPSSQQHSTMGRMVSN